MSDQTRPPPPATGYPVPPPPHPQPPYYPNQPFYSNPRSLFLRRFFTSLALIFIIFFIIFFICWLVIRPRHPQFHITSLSLRNLTINTSNNRVSGTFFSTFQVYNPNKKMEIYYDYVVSSVMYHDAILDDTRLPPFDQAKRNQTVVDVMWNVVDAYVDKWVVNGMHDDGLKGSVSFNVKVEASVEFRIGRLRARKRFLRVLCGDVAVKISGGSGSMSGGSKECKVYV